MPAGAAGGCGLETKRRRAMRPRLSEQDRCACSLDVAETVNRNSISSVAAEITGRLFANQRISSSTTGDRIGTPSATNAPHRRRRPGRNADQRPPAKRVARCQAAQLREYGFRDRDRNGPRDRLDQFRGPSRDRSVRRANHGAQRHQPVGSHRGEASRRSGRRPGRDGRERAQRRAANAAGPAERGRAVR